MKSRTILILSALLFVFLTLAVFQMKQQPAEATGEDSTRVITIGENEDAVGVVLYNENDYTTLRRQNENWAIETPFSAEADRQKVETFLRTVFGLHYIRKLTDGISDLSPFGFLERSCFGIFSFSGNRRDTLFLGARTPAGSWYLRKNSDPAIYTVAAEFGEFLQRKPEEWRMRRLGDWPLFGISSVRIIAPQAEIELLKDATDLAWTIRKPRPWPGSHPAIQNLLRTIFETQAIDILPSKAMSRNAGYGLLVKNDRGESIEILAQPCAANCLVWRKGASEVFEMPASFGSVFSGDWNRLRDRRLFRQMNLDSVDRVEIADDTSGLIVRRRDSIAWVFEKPIKNIMADEKVVGEFLKALAILDADSVFDVDGTPSPEANHLAVKLGIEKQTMAFQFVSKDEETRAYSDGACFVLGQNGLDRLWKGVEYFRK